MDNLIIQKKVSRFIYFFIASLWLLIYGITLVLFSAHNFPSSMPPFSQLLLFTSLVALTVIPFALLLFISPQRSIIRITLVSVFIIYQALDIILVGYQYTRGIFFDFYYFWFHRFEVSETLANTYGSFAVIVAVIFFVLIITGIALYQASVLLAPRFSKRRHWYIPVVLCVIFTIAFVVQGMPLKRLYRDALIRNRIEHFDSYTKLFQESFPTSLPEDISFNEDGNSVLLLHLESLNSSLVNPRIAPQFFNYASKGILFTKHHSSGVQTHRAEEVMLCGTLPSLNTIYDPQHYHYVTDSAREEGLEITCLPKILKEAGYITLFFKSHTLEFQGAGDFAKAIGFDEAVDARTLFQEGDPILRWGMREDVYYQRVVEYIKLHYPSQKVFAYVVVSSTNHAPFRATEGPLPSELRDSLPFSRHAEDYHERRINAAYAQDFYIQDFFDAYGAAFGWQSTDVWMYGDHPLAILKRGNPEYSYNIDGANEENFLTSLAFIPAENYREQFQTRRVLTNDVGTSHMGIMPTILELYGLHNPRLYDMSFASRLRGSATPEDASLCSVNVQPYAGAKIALVQFPYKILLHLTESEIEFVKLGGARESVLRKKSLSNELVDVYLNYCLSHRLGKLVVEESR